MTETTIETTIDWEKCWQLATQLGAHTRALIVGTRLRGNA
jgi:hypothetical protein